MRKSNVDVARDVMEEAAGVVVNEVILALSESGVVLPLGTMQAIFARVQKRVERLTEDRSGFGK